MKIDAFKLLHDMEDSWWYKGRMILVDKLLRRLKKVNNKILDFGSGYGGMYDTLAKYGKVYAFEIDKGGLISCKERGYEKIYSSADDVYNLKSDLDLVVMCDVLEHIEDDDGTLRSINNILRDKGYLLMTIPAYKWLWSIHDDEHKHYRRYTRGQINSLLNKNGFEVDYSSYWNLFLFVPALIVRLFGFSGSSSLKQPKIVNSIFLFFIYIERMIMPNLTLPFGTGIIVLARKVK